MSMMMCVMLFLAPCAQDGFTALMRASEIDPKMVQTLLDAGADMEARHFVGGAGGGHLGGGSQCGPCVHDGRSRSSG